MSEVIYDLRLKNHNTGITGGFRFIHPETLVTIGPTTSFGDLTIAVREYVKHRGLAPVSELDMERQICARMPEACRRATQREIEQSVPVEETVVKGVFPPIVIRPIQPGTARKKLKFTDVVNATLKLAGWVVKGRRKVNAQVAESRARVCLGCENHAEVLKDGSPGCCSDPLLRAVDNVVGQGGFPSYNSLGACAACGCSLRAKVQLPLEYVRDLKEELPDHCWIVVEAKEN